MDKWKIADMVLSAISALVAAAKATMKFINYIKRLRHQPVAGTA